VSARRPGWDVWCAAASVLGFAVIGLCIAAPVARHPARGWSSMTIYPWWSLLLVAAGMVIALASVLRRDHVAAAVGAPVTGVLAAELAGLGIVAVKHWRPAMGISGFGLAGDLRTLQRLGLLISVAGVATSAAALIRLFVGGEVSRAVPPRVRWWAVAVGAAVLVLLPVVIGRVGSGHGDATSLAAYALIYSAPWGLSIALTGWLGRVSARAVTIACAFCASLALIGPQMADLVHPQPFVAFSLALGAALVALTPRLR
jgi:hypothetical protein